MDYNICNIFYQLTEFAQNYLELFKTESSSKSEKMTKISEKLISKSKLKKLVR